MTSSSLLQVLISTVLSGGLATVITSYVAWRRLPGQRRLDNAQVESMFTATAKELLAMNKEELSGCREECAALRGRLERAERRINQLESAMRRAGVAVPAAPR